MERQLVDLNSIVWVPAPPTRPTPKKGAFESLFVSSKGLYPFPYLSSSTLKFAVINNVEHMIESVLLKISTETFVSLQLPIALALIVHLFSQWREPTSIETLVVLGCLNILQFYVFHIVFNQSVLGAIYNSSRSMSIFLVTISTSIFVYRLGFHRLNHFPGPKTLIASKWTMIPVDLKGNVSGTQNEVENETKLSAELRAKR